MVVILSHSMRERERERERVKVLVIKVVVGSLFFLHFHSLPKLRTKTLSEDEDLLQKRLKKTLKLFSRKSWRHHLGKTRIRNGFDEWRVVQVVLLPLLLSLLRTLFEASDLQFVLLQISAQNWMLHPRNIQVRLNKDRLTCKRINL